MSLPPLPHRYIISVFSRYNITDTADILGHPDIREALIKVGEYAKIRRRRAKRA
jgi:hypothetical protein